MSGGVSCCKSQHREQRRLRFPPEALQKTVDIGMAGNGAIAGLVGIVLTGIPQTMERATDQYATSTFWVKMYLILFGVIWSRWILAQPAGNERMRARADAAFYYCTNSTLRPTSAARARCTPSASRSSR